VLTYKEPIIKDQKRGGGLNMDEYYKHKVKFSPELCERIREMKRSGIRSGSRQSEVLKRGHGVEIPPHIIAEYKCRKRHEETGVSNSAVTPLVQRTAEWVYWYNNSRISERNGYKTPSQVEEAWYSDGMDIRKYSKTEP
jgi:hypothetical protein